MGTTTTQTSEDTDADQRSLATPDSTYPKLMMHAAADAVMSAIIEYAISCGSFGLSIAANRPPDGLFGWRLNTRCTVRNAMPRAVAVPASPATPFTPVPVSPKSQCQSAAPTIQIVEITIHAIDVNNNRLVTRSNDVRTARAAGSRVALERIHRPTTITSAAATHAPAGAYSVSQSVTGCASEMTGSTGDAMWYKFGSGMNSHQAIAESVVPRSVAAPYAEV